MKKSLIALAALAAVGTASAQSSVTLSGIIKGGVAVTQYTHGPIGTNTNGTGWNVNDGSSRFIISGVEDLGGGLKGLFQIDTRFRVDDNGNVGSAGNSVAQLATGNTFVGLGGAFGTFSIGKRDTHYCLGSDTHGNLATALQASSCGILGYVNVGGAGINQSIANTSRSTNIVRYDSPNFAGFSGSVSVSPNFSYTASEAGVGDIGKGNAYNVALSYANGPLTVSGSYWYADSENRNFGAARADQRAGTLTAGFQLGVFNIGATWDRSEVRTGLVKISETKSRRDAWSIPVTMKLGNGTLLATYTRALDTRVGGTKISDSGAWLASVGYSYALSKRTSVGLSFAYLNNDRNSAYQLYTQNSLGGLSPALVGQDQKQLYLGVRHAF